MSAMAANLLAISMVVCFCVWSLASQRLYMERMFQQPLSTPALVVWWLLKWPALTSSVGASLVTLWLEGNLGFFDYAWTGGALALWLLFRDVGDDDFKKKLKNRLKDKIAAIQGKLVVVPEPA